MLPGDVVRPGNEIVGTDDAAFVQANPGLLMPGVGPILFYDPFNDLNGDGAVNGLDVQSAVSRNTARLPGASSIASFATTSDSKDSNEDRLVFRSGATSESASTPMNLAGAQEANEKNDSASDSQVDGKQAETKAESIDGSVDSVFENFFDQGSETL